MASLTLDAVLWWTLKGSVIVAFAFAATTLLRHRPAAVRHALWTVAVIAQLALPLTERVPAARAMTVAVPPVASAAVEPDPTSLAAPAPRTAEQTAPLSLLHVLGFVTAALLLRLGVGTLQVMAIARRSSRIIDGEWLSLAQELCATLGIRRPVTLIRAGTLPVTWGLVYPAILIPAAADAWPRALRRHVLLHELAHVRRFDALSQLAAQLALALFWFNPLVWLAVRRMRAEAENACDDYVLRDGERPSAYAATLVALVDAHHGASVPAFASLSVGRRSELEQRVGAITSSHRDPSAARLFATIAVAAAAIVVVPLSAVQRVREARTIDCRPFVFDEAVRETSGTLTQDGKTTHYYFLRPAGTRCIEASYSLDARFTEEERDLVATPGLEAMLREVTPHGDRRAHVTAAERQLFIDDRPAPWDQRWYEAMIEESIRLTSAGVAERTASILAREGVEGVFAEVDRIPPKSSVRRLYLEELLPLLDSHALPRERLIAKAREAIDYPPELESFLAVVAAREGGNS